MPLRVGEMMVVIRAQDFASRTLRRVGGEFAHMSRAQAIAAQKSDLALNRLRALEKVQDLNRTRDALRMIAKRNALMTTQYSRLVDLAHAENALFDAQRRRVGLVDVHNRELRSLQAQLRTAKEMRRSEVRRKDISPAQRVSTMRAIESRLASLPARTSAAFQAADRAVLQHQKIVDKLGGSWRATSTGLDRLNQKINQLPPAFRGASNSAAVLAEAMTRNQRALRDAYQNLDIATRKQMAFNHAVSQMPVQRLRDAGHAISGIGRTMQLFGAVGTAAFGLAAVSAANFSQAVSLAATQMTEIGAGTDVAQAHAAELREEILQLSKDFPFAAKEMADAAYEIFSSTSISNIEDGVALLEAFARVGVAGQVDIQTATKASITVLNTFRGATDDVGSTLNRMFSIVRYGRMRFEDFADMLPKVAAAAYGSGQSLDDVAGIMAFLTRKTADAGIAATQISRAFDVFSRAEFRDGIKALGVDIEDMEGKLLPLPQVLKKIMDEWGAELVKGGKGSERFIQIVTRASQEAGKGFLSTAEARRFFRFLFSDFGTYLDLQEKAVKNNDQFEQQFETMMADPGVQWEIFTQRLKALVIEIGQHAIPVFASLGQHIADFLDWWDRMNESTQGTIIKWAVMASVGALVAGIFLSIAGAVISLAIGLGGALVKLTGFIGRLAGLSRAIPLARLALFARLLGLVSGITIAYLAMKVAFTGDATAIDFITGIIAGAGVGFMLGGPAGAVVGAITVPIILKVIQDAGGKSPQEQAFDEFQKQMGKGPGALETFMNIRGKGFGAFGIIQDYLKDAGKTMVLTRKQFEDEWGIMTRAMKTKVPTPALVRQLENIHPAVVRLFNKYNKGVDDASKKHKGASESFDEWMKSLKKSLKEGDMKALFKALGMDDALETFDEQLDQSKDAMADWSKSLADATRQARVDVLSSLRSMYTEMLQLNQEAMGELFQGPWLTSETFDLAKEWGVVPRIQDMIRDLKEQNAAFMRWRQSLDAIFKKGVPKEFVDELRQMGPEEGQAFIDQIIAATPAQRNALINEWKKRNKAVQEATKMDFTQEINQFKKAGLSMGEAIKNGFQDAEVAAWFDTWVTRTFPQVINSAVNQAVNEWKKGNPRPEQPPKPGPKNNELNPNARPRNGRAPGNQPAGGDTYHTGKVISVTAPIHLSGQMGPFNPDVVARTTAFKLVNHIKHSGL